MPERKTSQSPLRVLPRSQSPQLAELFESFLLDKRASNLAEKTLAYYSAEFRRFMAWAGPHGVQNAADLTVDCLRRYAVDMRERGYKPTSQHAALRALKAFCNWTVSQGYATSSPFARFTMPKLGKEQLPALSEEQVKALLDAAKGSARDTAILLCLLDSGMRANEFVNVSIADYAPRSGQVVVRVGKGDKQRVTFFGPKAQAELRRYLYSRGNPRADMPLFVSERGNRRLTVSGLEKILNRLGQQAGVHVTPHALRRTCALWAHRRGWSLESLRLLLGHSDFSVLRRYLALDDADIAEAHRNAPPTGLL